MTWHLHFTRYIQALAKLTAEEQENIQVMKSVQANAKLIQRQVGT